MKKSAARIQKLFNTTIDLEIWKLELCTKIIQFIHFIFNHCNRCMYSDIIQTNSLIIHKMKWKLADSLPLTSMITIET